MTHHECVACGSLVELCALWFGGESVNYYYLHCGVVLRI